MITMRFGWFILTFGSMFLPGAFAQGSSNSYGYRIAYATYFGGSKYEQAREIIVYPDGSILVGGQTSSPDLPTTSGVVQPKYAGDDPALVHGGIFGGDCFLFRLNPQGSRVTSASYFGGSKQERNVYGMGLDRAGNIVITSATRSPDLPTTTNCYQAKYGGKPSDWMVAKLSADLKRLLWCTYVGGSGDDFPRGGLALDQQDNVYIVGGTNSPNFPTTQGVFQRKLKGGHSRDSRDAAIVKLSADGSKLLFGTLYGGSNWDGLMGIRLDNSDSFYVVGHTQSADLPLPGLAAQKQLGGKSDCFLARFSPQADKLLYATYLGGALNEFAEHRPYLAADGTVLITGVTGSMNFPTTPGAYQTRRGGKTDGFLTQLSSGGDRFSFSTYLGGKEGEFFLTPSPDKIGNIFLVGTTQSLDFPVTANALQKRYHGSAGKWNGDGALAVISKDGSKLLYASYLGGSGADLIRSIALAPDGAVYLVGSTSSKDFPVTPDVAQATLRGSSDAFVVKLTPTR